MKISRNALCPCGSGKKYKHCHINKPLPGEEGSETVIAESNAKTKKTAYSLIGLGLLLSIGIGIWQQDALTGIVVAAACVLGILAYMSIRNPPPPNENAGDPAALNFGRQDDSK